jgi:hypothetical protein
MLLLSASVMFWARWIQQSIAISGQSYGDMEARAQAHSGLALALHPLVSKETPILSDYAANEPGFRVRLVSEGAKLNINFLLAGEDPRKLDILNRWLESRGLDFNQRQVLVDCLLDWIDADNLKRLHGMEDNGDYHPPNRGQFLTVDEIADVAGTDVLVTQSGWQDDLTVFSQGPIDVTSADFPVLRLLPGVGDGGIQRFLQYRRGDDQIDGTEDDPQIQRLEQVQNFLGLNKTQWNALGGLIMLRDQTWHVYSEGHSGKVIRQVEVVARKGGQNPQILSWKE